MPNDDDPKNPSGLVRVQDCHERHEVVKTEFALLKTALFGSDGRGGIVKDISDIKNALKHRWTLKDLATFIMALAALLAALYQYFH
jgi:hypothetical protein